MIKRPRLAYALLLCLSMAFVSCDKGEDTKKDDEDSSKKDSDGSSDSDKDSDGSSDSDKDSDGSSDSDKDSDSDSDSGSDKESESDSDGSSDSEGDTTSGGDESSTEGGADAVAVGRKFYDENGCKVCHGANGEKKAGASSLVDAKDSSDEVLTKAMKEGRRAMQPIKGVTDEELEALVKLIRCFQEKGDDAADCGNE